MPRTDNRAPAFTRRRDRIHDSGLIFISDAELAEQGVRYDARCGTQILYNGVAHSIRAISMHGILIWKLGERGPV